MAMRPWTWFAIAALWLIVPQVVIYAGGLSVGVMTGKRLPEDVALGVAALLMKLIVWGWVIPLSIGIWRLAKKRFGH